MCLGLIATGLLSRLPDPYWLLFIFSFVWMIPAQIAANRINSAIVPDQMPDGRFNEMNIVGIVLGGLTMALIVISFFKPW